MKKSLRLEILIILLIVVAISIGVTAYLSISSIMKAEEIAKSSGKKILQEQAEKFLVQLAASEAEKNNMFFENVREDVDTAAEYAKNIFDNPDAFARESYWKFDEHIFKGKGGQHMNGPNDVSSVFIPNYISIDKIKREMELNAHLDLVFPGILKNNPDSVAIYTIGLQGETRYYPNIGLGNILPPDYRTHEQIFFTIAAPENNPEKKTLWTPVYDDPAGQGLMVSSISPVYTKNGFIGVLGSDVTLDNIAKSIAKYKPIDYAFFFLVDKDGYLIAMSKHGYEDILGREPEQGETRVNLNNLSYEFASVLDKMKKWEAGFSKLSLNNKRHYIAYAPLKEMGFSLGLAAEEKDLLKAAEKMEAKIDKSAQDLIYFRILPTGILLLFASGIIGFILIGRITNSMKEMAEAAKEISQGNYKVKLSITADNELGQLSSSFNQMSDELEKSRQKLENYGKELEKKVEERTRELKAKNEELGRFNKLAIGRENAMIELKRKLKEMEEKQKQ